MFIENILAQIDAEILRLTQARALLANTGKVSTKLAKRVGIKVASPQSTKIGKKRVLSPDARKRIADAQHKRWAAQKTKSK